MELEAGGLITLSIFILGLIWHASNKNYEVKELMEHDYTNKKRLNALEKEQIKMEQALERTFATEHFVYEAFITRKEHTDTVERLEEKLMSEMRHMNISLNKLVEIVEKNHSISVER